MSQNLTFSLFDQPMTLELPSLVLAQNMANARGTPSLGGYDEEFVNVVDEDWQCAICQLPLKDPMLTKCGHRFCRQCIDEHLRRLEVDRQESCCPVDQNNLIQHRDIFADKATERKILCLIVKCPNEDCDWTGELRSKEHHLSCCPLTLISCPYDQVGCGTKIHRREVEKHLESALKIHLDLACVKLSDMQVQLNNTQKELKETKRKLAERDSALVNMVWKISDFSEILRQAKSGDKIVIESEPFFKDGYKLKLRLFPYVKDEEGNANLSLYLKILKGEYDAILPWPFHKKLIFLLIDQQENAKERKNIVKSFTTNPEDKEFFGRPMARESSGKGFASFISHNKLSERRYIVDDTLFFQLQVVPPQYQWFKKLTT